MKTLFRFRVNILCLVVIIYGFPAFSQDALQLKTGTFPLLKPSTRSYSTDEPAYYFYAADHVITDTERTSLQRSGIEILLSLKNNMYWVRVNSQPSRDVMDQMFVADNSYKANVDASKRNALNKWRLSIATGLETHVIEEWAQENNIRLLDTRVARYGMIDVEADPIQFQDLLNTPWVSFVEEIPVDIEINYRMFDAERAWELVSPLTRGLSGEGITIGIGDGGRLGVHQDISDNVLDLTSFSVSGHATQVTGIVTGAGLFDPAYGRGYAPAAQVIMRNFSDILWDAPQYINDYNLSLTNNSYGTSPDDCSYIGDYTGTSTALDAMMKEHPNLLHVFAAGNSGGLSCPPPFPFRSATIQGGYQVTKNVLTVGAIQANDVAALFSSRGPVDDGRIKPEVVAQGAGRFSTIDNHQYTSNSGTSFSSPAATGLAALLSQRYKQLHNDSLPAGNLIKNLICNGADEIGLTGPDFIYGFGRINGVCSIEMMESNQYRHLTLQHGQTVMKQIQISANTASVDVMLSWPDFPSAPYETVALVNDLDIYAIDPMGDTIRPWILNPTPDGVNMAATKGIDRLNNNEQISIPNPVPGNYIIVINGYHVPMGPQEAWLTWDVQLNGITVRSPNAGEIFKPGNPNHGLDRHYVRWDAYGTGNATFTAEYSTDDGNNWTLIANNIPAVRRYQEWFLPNVHTDKLRVRVTASNGMTAISNTPSTIMAPPANVSSSSPCDGYVNISWNAVAGAVKYYVYSLREETLVLLDSTTSTSMLIDRFQPDHEGWISVAGVFPSGKIGMRARAITVNANGGSTCSWNHDLRLDNVLSPVSGRQMTSTALSSSEEIEVTITNLGLNSANAFQLSYQVDNNNAVTEVFSGNLGSGLSIPFTFLEEYDFSQAGEYNLKIWITYSSDPFKKNDTLYYTLKHLANNAISLPWHEGFESSTGILIDTSTFGLPSSHTWDVTMTPGSRLRTFAGSSFCHSGNRALTIDAVRNAVETGTTTLTLNLDEYNIMEHDIRLSLYYMHHHIFPDVIDEVIEVRGSDAMPFVPLVTLSDEAGTRGQWQQLSGLEVSDALTAAGQDYSSSFQIRFPFSVNATAGSIFSQDGQTIDDLSLELVGDDLKIDSLITPTSISCGLGTEQIIVSITNTTFKPVTQVFISYRVNNGSTFTTAAGTIAGNANMLFELDPAFNFSLPGSYHLDVWLSAPGDLFHHNDTLHTTILHLPLINSFPYREDFESSDGSWLTRGSNNSWAHGTPAKEILSHAAEGNKAWMTGITKDYNADELSYLYSPCFDLSPLNNPYLSFAFKYQFENNFDFAWIEYRLENSEQWIKLGAFGNGTNWYNHNSNAWTGTRSKWLTTGIDIPITDTILQLRWVFQSDVGVELEGIALDQVNLYERKSIYTGSSNQWTIPVSGNDWVHIDDGAQRIFSIHPLGQNLGSVSLTLHQSSSHFINGDSLYLLKRHWVVNSTLPVITSVLVRGYFTSAEADSLVKATGCDQCLKSKDAFDVCALRYSGINEDLHYHNNTASGISSFHKDSTEVYPYENGYYAEWKSNAFSEWWISSPVTKQQGDVVRRISQWSDDAEEHAYTGAVNPVRDTLSLTFKDGQQQIGWRFKNITIPKGSYISSATLSLISGDAYTDPALWALQSEMSNDAGTFTTNPYQLSLRPRSDIIASWSPVPWSGDITYTSPEIRHLIQQVTDQPGWATGNDLALHLSGNGLRNAWSFDGDPLKAATLMITYEEDCLDAGICYVNHDAAGNQDGSSWANAYRTLEQALEKKLHCPAISEIWIAGGIYKPYYEVTRQDHFTIPQGISLYGGFAGNETSTLQRVPGLYPTVISGDIGIAGNTNDNSYHVVTIMTGLLPVLLDGITISAGNANGPLPDDQKGGGILNRGRLICRNVMLLNNSYPAIYNAPGGELEASGIVEIRP